MQLIKIFYLLLFSLFSCINMKAQENWKKRFGLWINVELDKRLKLNQPFDSTAHVVPRFLWIRNIKEVEIEQRFEQKRKYLVRNITNEQITIKDAQLFLRGDTIIMKDNFDNVVKFIKHQ